MADKMMKVAARGKDGLAKAVRSDNQGNMMVKLPAEHQRFNANELMTGKVAADFAIRDTIGHTFDFPQAIDGIFEQSISVWNNTNQPVSLQISVMQEYDGEGLKPSKTIWSTTQNGNIAVGERITFIPEKGIYETTESKLRNVDLLELRLPYHTIRFIITATVAPTTGDIRFSVMKRY